MRFLYCGPYRGEEPNPDLTVAAHPEPTDAASNVIPGVMGDEPVVVQEESLVPGDSASAKLRIFGSSEYAKALLHATWGRPPELDLEAEADLHAMLFELANRGLMHSARDISDGGISVALAQAAFANNFGARVEQEQPLMVHPLFGLFAEPASTVVLTADPEQVSEIERLQSISTSTLLGLGQPAETGWRSPSTATYSSRLHSRSCVNLGQSLWKQHSTMR